MKAVDMCAKLETSEVASFDLQALSQQGVKRVYQAMGNSSVCVKVSFYSALYINALGKALQMRQVSLRALKLRGTGSTAMYQGRALGNALTKSNRELYTLRLSALHLNEEDFYDLVSFLPGHEHIQELDIDCLPEQGYLALVQAAKQNQSLRRLRLFDMYVTDEEDNNIGVLGELLLANRQLEELKVHSSVYDKAMDLIAQALHGSNDSKLRVLDLGEQKGFARYRRSTVKHGNYKHLGPMFATNTTLRVCRIHGINLARDEDVEALVQGLQANKTLEVLALTACGIKHHAKLVQALQASSSLHTLDLSCAQITKQGFVDIANALKQPATLRYFAVSAGLPNDCIPLVKSMLICSIEPWKQAMDDRLDFEFRMRANQLRLCYALWALCSCAQIKRISIRSAMRHMPNELLRMAKSFLTTEINLELNILAWQRI